MGLVNSALHIGRSAITSSQGALQIIGNNVSGVNSPDYTRLTPQLDPMQGTPLARGLQPGAGTALTGIRRNIDEALEGRVRLANSDVQAAKQQQTTLAQLESYFDDVNGTGIGSRLTTLFNAFDDLANSPEDDATRDLALARGQELASSFHELRSQLAQLSADADAQIGAVVEEADSIVQEIAELNRQITQSEAGSSQEDTALRDRRDGLLRDLSNYFEVTVRPQTNGAINLYVGSETLVQGNQARRLIAVEDMLDGRTRTTVRFADTNAQVGIQGGQLGGLIVSRDQYGQQQIAAIDELASALIYEVNRIHADGQGMEAYRQLTGSVEVQSTDVPLSDAGSGLHVPPHNGSFYLTVFDDLTGTPTAHRIDVNLTGSAEDTTLESLVADINAQAEGVTAAITADNHLSLTAEAGFSFTFGHDGQHAREDTSGALAALGVNTFFAGQDAADIEVNEALQADPTLVAASSVFLAGDGSTALRLAQLDEQRSDVLRGVSLNGYYDSIANTVAVNTAAINDEVEAASSVHLSLQAQRESLSGVNLDEEALSLLKFERAFQGASRYVTVVDDLIAELIALVR